MEEEKPNGGKFLAIKNWEKYQPDVQHPTYIRDYVNKADDPDFQRLTLLQREVLEGLCRLRGRSARNICNDPVHIARALCVLPKEHRYLPCAIRKLTLCGFLIPTDQQVNFNATHILEKRREEKNRREDKKITTSPVREEALEHGAANGAPHFLGQKLKISQANHLAFAAAFEGTDLESEYRKMDAWLISNKRNYRDFGRFANSWLNRSRIPGQRKSDEEQIRDAFEKIKRRTEGQ